MPPLPFSEPIDRIVPAAVVQAWGPPGSAALRRLEAQAGKGFRLLPAGPWRWMAIPLPGDPAIFDRALAFAAEAIPAASTDPELREVRILVVPAAARIGQNAQLIPDPQLAELVMRRPALEPAKILFTSHAALQLEGSFAFENAAPLALQDGRQIPLVTVRATDAATGSWRNPEVLSRSLRWIARPELEALFRARLAEPLLRVEGPIGVGKTRLVSELLRGAGEPIVWRNAGAARLAPLDRALASEPTRPLRLVYDHLDMATPALWAEIEELLKHPALGRELRPIFVSRPSIPWPGALAGATPLRVGRFDETSWNRFTAQLFRGLSLPEAVAEELASGAGGNPFALEEALLFLVRDRKLRQVYGSFFFSGSEEAQSPLRMSQRFVAHLEAEAMRLGAAMPLRLLTQAESAVPASELAAAVLALGGEPPPRGWDSAYVEAGLIEIADGPWGEGRALASSAFRVGLAATLAPPEAARLRLELGELLSARSAAADEMWAAHALLAGSEAGARTLLALAPGGSRLPKEALFTALRHELASLRERPPDPALEIDLLWVLLPLARRMGRLHELLPALERGFELARDQPARFLSIAGLRADLAQMAGRYGEAETVLRQALAASREGDHRKKELLLLELVRILVRQGKTTEARDLLTRTLAVAERRGRKNLATTCRFFLGNIALHEFRLDEAAALHERALADRRAQGMGGVATSLTALGAVALARGDAPRSLAYFEEAREVLVALGSEAEEAFALVGVGRSMARLGDVAGAAPVLRRALALREKRDDAVGEAIARLAVAENTLLLDHPEDALTEARKAYFVLALQPEGEALADADQLLGRIQSRLRRHDAAIAHFEEASRVHEALGKRASRLADWSHRIPSELARGRPDDVRAAYDTVAAARAALPDAPTPELHDFHLFLAADWLEQRGRTELKPLAHLERAYSGLMRQTSFLDKGMRQRFLLEVPLNRAIIDAAARRKLALPQV